MPPQHMELGTAEIRRSDAMSHAYIQYPPFRCDLPGALGVTYDDGNKLLIVPTAENVYSWKTVDSASPEDPVVTPAKAGPVLGARFSLNFNLLAILRSDTEVEFINRQTGTSFKQACKSDKVKILGVFWSDSPGCDVVFVTTSGLELYALELGKNSLKLADRKRQDISWYVYTHESRLVLLASGMQCKTLTGYQFSTKGVIRLPKFEASLSKEDFNRKPVLVSEHVYIATMYGRLYCLQVDPPAKILHVYRFYRDAVISQGSLPVYASNITLSVVDNVLLVHQRDSKVVLLYDVLSDARVPISAPLPLLLRWPKENATASAYSRDFTLYEEGWIFVNPDVILDHAHGLLWKIYLDLEAIAVSSSDVPSLLSFLQRRRHEAAKAKQLCASLLRSMIMERRSLSLISVALSAITTACGHMKRLENNTPAPPPAPLASDFYPAVPLILTPGLQPAALSVGYEFKSNGSSSSETSGGLNCNGKDVAESSGSRSDPVVSNPALTPLEVYENVFAPVEEGMTVESSFLAAVIIEYMRSAAVEQLVIPPELNVLLVQLIARDHCYDKLYHLVADKVLEPSKPLATQLLEIGSQCTGVKILGVEMLRQAHAHKDYVSCLLQEGQVVQALRYARRNKLELECPSIFFEAALLKRDQVLLASVMRFFCDFVPDFEQTQDYAMYMKRLTR